MISDEERIEVAAKLREKKEDFFGVRSFFPQDLILYQSLYLKAIEECLPDGDCCFDVLAELIDVPTAKGIIEDVPDARTCRNLATKPADELLCSRCGEHVDIAYMESADDYHARYCPNCGAKVVDE